MSISQPHLLHGVLWGGQARRSTAARCIAPWSWQTGGASWSPGSAAALTPTLCWPARSQAAPGPSHPDPLTASHEAGGVGLLTGGAADSRIELGTASRCSGCMQRRKAVLASQVESGCCHRDAAPRDGCDGICSAALFIGCLVSWSNTWAGSRGGWGAGAGSPPSPWERSSNLGPARRGGDLHHQQQELETGAYDIGTARLSMDRPAGVQRRRSLRRGGSVRVHPRPPAPLASPPAGPAVSCVPGPVSPIHLRTSQSR